MDVQPQLEATLATVISFDEKKKKEKGMYSKKSFDEIMLPFPFLCETTLLMLDFVVCLHHMWPYRASSTMK